MHRYGGDKSDWIDLSTGINPVPYPMPIIGADSWHKLPDSAAKIRLENAARNFWQVPDGADILAAAGASSLIARIPGLADPGTVAIAGPTYNEHAAAFAAFGWQITARNGNAIVVVHPNNPDGRFWDDLVPANRLTIIDESFCDVAPERSLINLSTRPGTLVLKSFGKFWGLAGLRLGFVIGDVGHIAKLAEALGPWPVSGPALAIGADALENPRWASATRKRLDAGAGRLDRLMTARGANIVGGTSLYRLYDVDTAAGWQDRLAKARVWSRVFPYTDRWLRLGLPAPGEWAQLDAAL